jgi:hypothetical protein
VNSRAVLIAKIATGEEEEATAFRNVARTLGCPLPPLEPHARLIAVRELDAGGLEGGSESL